MRRFQPTALLGRPGTVLDLALLCWTVVWVVLGIWIGSEVRGLRALSSTTTRVGVAVEESGKAIGSLGGLPLVGGALDTPAQRIEEAGRSAQASGRKSRESVEDLSVLLALSVGLIPTVPILLLYVPWRLAVVRERRSIARAMVRGDPELNEYLARRAAEHLSYRRLRLVTATPWRDIEEGRFDALAAAELETLGLTRSDRR